MKVTYNQIISQLETFANDHYQIESFKNGDLWEAIQHNQLTDWMYPLLFVVDQPGTLEQGSHTFSFDILCMDKATEEIENEVKSDTHQILLDVVAYMEKLITDEWYFLQIEKTSSFESFTERFDDVLTGWKININLKQPFTYNDCAIPKT